MKKTTTVSILTITLIPLIFILYKYPYKTNNHIYNFSHFCFSVLFIYYPICEFYKNKITKYFK